LDIRYIMRRYIWNAGNALEYGDLPKRLVG
jgi:hypothetical protein